MLAHILDQNLDRRVYCATVIGLCKLILHGQHYTRELMSKFLLQFFNPATEPEINQIFGIFFESIIRMKKQESLHDALIPTMVTLFEAPVDSPLHEVKKETVLKYVIGATRPVFCSNGLNLHNTLGLKFLQIMSENLECREIHRVFSKELLLLEIGDDPLLKKDMVAKIDALLVGINVDQRARKNITNFRDMLRGCYREPLKFSSTAMTSTLDSDAGGVDESGDEEKDKISLDDIMDVSLSKVNFKECVVNISVRDLKNQENDVSMSESSKQVGQNKTQVPATQDPSAASTSNSEISQQESFEVSATQSEDSSSDHEDGNNTVKTVVVAAETETPETDDEIIPATPEATPARPKRTVTNKRHLETSRTISSPLRKHQKSDESTKITPKTPRAHSIMASPQLSTLPKSKVSTPSTERITRRQTREEVAQTLTLTRSASKKLNIDPEAAEKVVTEVKAAKAPAKKTVEVPVKKAASAKEKSANERQTRAKPRWR